MELRKRFFVYTYYILVYKKIHINSKYICVDEPLVERDVFNYIFTRIVFYESDELPISDLSIDECTTV